MIRMHWLAALALVAAVPASAQKHEDPLEQTAIDTELGEAINAIQSGKPAEAIAIVDPLLVKYEKRYAGEKRKIYCAHYPAQAILYVSEAKAANKKSLILDPNWCTALWARGFALIDLNQIDAAVPFLERAVALSPSHPHYLSELGYAYQVQKKWQLSHDMYQRAAAGAALEAGDQRKKSLRRAWFGMGYDLIELGKLEEAEKVLAQCLELTPDDQKVKDELQYVREQRKKAS